jgi:hypothetical protein
MTAKSTYRSLSAQRLSERTVQSNIRYAQSLGYETCSHYQQDRLCNTETRSFNHCCSGNVISITCSEGMIVVLGVHQAKYLRHFVVCGLHGCTLFFHIIS